MKRLLALALLITASGPLWASEVEQTTIGDWYTALASVNRVDIANLLSDKATITLGDLDIEQNKSEFIASLDEWEDAMKGSSIRHAIQSDADGVLTVLVCYKFPDNEALGREVFTFEAAKILTSAQETVAESCDEFPN